MLIPMYSIFQDSPLVADSSISLFTNFTKINTRDGLFDSAYSSCSILYSSTSNSRHIINLKICAIGRLILVEALASISICIPLIGTPICTILIQEVEHVV